MKGPRSPSWVLLLIAVLSIVTIAWRAISQPQQEFGDGREYILQTQAIVFDHAISVDPARRGDYWNRTNPFAIQLPLSPAEDPSGSLNSSVARQCAPGYGSLYLAKDGHYRFAHTWMYSLFAAPFYAVMHAISPGDGEYLVFRLLNVALLFIPLGMLWWLRPTWSSFVFLILVVISPLTPHLQWAHSELFCCSAVLSAFVSLRYPRMRWWGPLALGMGAAQNIPIALFYPLHLWLMVREEGASRVFLSWRRLASYLVSVSLPFCMMAYYYYNFGVFNLIAAVGGADTSVLTAARLLSVFLSPEIGVFWYFPAAWLAVVVSWRRGERGTVLFCCFSVLAVAAFCSTTTNINSAQLSSPRYALWFLAPLYVLPFAIRADAAPGFSRRGVVVASLVAVGILLWLETYQFIEGEWQRFYSVNRADPRVAKIYRVTHFDDDIEPLVENIQGKELIVPRSFDGVYIWNLSGAQSMWIVSKRAWMSMRSLTVTGDVLALQSSDSLREGFEMSEVPSGGVRLVPRRDVVFRSHPYWGSYLLLWVRGDVASVASSVSTYLKNK